MFDHAEHLHDPHDTVEASRSSASQTSASSCKPVSRAASTGLVDGIDVGAADLAR